MAHNERTELSLRVFFAQKALREQHERHLEADPEIDRRVIEAIQRLYKIGVPMEYISFALGENELILTTAYVEKVVKGVQPNLRQRTPYLAALAEISELCSHFDLTNLDGQVLSLSNTSGWVYGALLKFIDYKRVKLALSVLKEYQLETNSGGGDVVRDFAARALAIKEGDISKINSADSFIFELLRFIRNRNTQH